MSPQPQPREEQGLDSDIDQQHRRVSRDKEPFLPAASVRNQVGNRPVRKGGDDEQNRGQHTCVEKTIPEEALLQ